MYYSFKEIVKSLPKKKNSKSSFWVKLIVRRVSFIFTYLFINVGFSAWGVSVFSIVIAIAGAMLLSINSEIWRLVGVILIHFWLILDCVDGNVARVKKSSSVMGEFIDAQSGYFISGFVYLAIGIAAYFTSELFSSTYTYLLIIIGAIASISNILSRLIHQKYVYSVLEIEKTDNDVELYVPQEEVETKKGLQYFRSRIDKEFGLSGLFMPFLIIAYIFELFDIMVIFYMLFSLSALLITSLYYSLKSNI